MTPGQKARQRIDHQFAQTGWLVQDYGAHNIAAGPGVVVREFPLTTGFADYLLYADAKLIGVAEAKKEGATLHVADLHIQHVIRDVILRHQDAAANRSVIELMSPASIGQRMKSPKSTPARRCGRAICFLPSAVPTGELR